MAVHVKICGVKTVADAEAAVRLGASSIGLNFVPSSIRRIDAPTARAISEAVHALGTKAIVVGVVADLSLNEMRALLEDAALDCLQLHGSESNDLLRPLLPHAYRAVRIANADDVAVARATLGDYLLVDAKVPGALGGTGHTFDWSLVKDLAEERRLTLAGGLTPDNVEAAIAAVHPYCVDVASGVESAPGVKDPAAMAAFIRAAQRV